MGRSTRGDGFWSGVGVGAALGFVCAPCAGPILAAVTSVSASSGATAQIVAVAISYAIGLSAVLLLYALGGRAVIERVRRSARGHIVERTLGVVLLATGVPMLANVDVRFEEALAKDQSLPGFLIDPTRSLESSNAVQNRLASLRPQSRFVTRQNEASTQPVPATDGVSISGVKTPQLPKLGDAPEFTDTQRWFNTPNGAPLTLAGMRGHVVLVDFWTYTCINCIRTLPFVEGLYSTYHRYGLDIVGVETPEFTFEQNAGNVQQAIHSDGLTYPVVQDNRYGTWNAWQNQYWPAEYLIDANGQVRHAQFGEGDYKQDEAAVRQLLYDAGARRLPPPMTATAIMPSTSLGTPETYLDDQRSQGFAEKLRPGVSLYAGTTNPALNQFALNGTFKVTDQSSTPVSNGASIIGAGQGGARVSGPDLRRRHPPQGQGATRRQADPRQAERRRRQPRSGDRTRAAPVLVGFAAQRPAASADGAGAPGGQRVRLHVRLVRAARARHLSQHRGSLEQVVGRVDVEQQVGVGDLERGRLDRRDASRSGRSGAEPALRAARSAAGR